MRCAQQRQVADAEPAAAQVMVIDIPMSQNLLMGEECQKACDDNFLKCTKGVRLLPLSAAAVCSAPASCSGFPATHRPRAPGASCPSPAPLIPRRARRTMPAAMSTTPLSPPRATLRGWCLLPCGGACLRIRFLRAHLVAYAVAIACMRAVSLCIWRVWHVLELWLADPGLSVFPSTLRCPRPLLFPRSSPLFLLSSAVHPVRLASVWKRDIKHCWYT